MSADYLIVEGDSLMSFSKELQENMESTYTIAHMGRDNGTYWALLERREKDD
jgi:N-acetylmuramoyl-L-alanine amidase